MARVQTIKHPDATYELQFLTPQQLRDHPSLSDIASFINDSFAQHHQDLIPLAANGTPGQPRVRHPTELPDELSPHGRCCVIFTTENDDDDDVEQGTTSTNGDLSSLNSTGKNKLGIPVACAAVKPWVPHLEQWNIYDGDFVDNDNSTTTNINNSGSQPRRPEGQEQEQEESTIREWEVTAVAVRQGKTYARKGLVPLCLAELERDLCRRFWSYIKPSSSSAPTTKTAPDSMRELTVWARTIREINGGYWGRRGFEEVAVVRCKRGTLSSVREFDIASLKRTIVL